MKSSLTVAAILIFASCAQAQSSHPHTVTSGGSGYNYSGGSWGSGGGWSGWGSSSGQAVVFEPPREYAAGYAKNDGDFVPSVYMNYEDALALGKQMLADEEARANGERAYSLGEAARAARVAKVPTLRLKSRIIQDNSGKMLVCNLNGNDCHKLSQTPQGPKKLHFAGESVDSSGRHTLFCEPLCYSGGAIKSITCLSFLR